ncbi:malto-oligosyltrehalose synthase [Klebsiella grimontii]
MDWTRPVTLPFLGDTFEAELESGALELKRDPATGKPAFIYYDQVWPLNPQTLATGEQLLTSPDRDAILALHEAQSWRLMSWREAPRQLSWRRFFEITGLIGVRVEDPAVFDDTHRLILELVHSGIVDGLRIDHIDGLADPLGYLQRLRQATGPECYITVEKILAKGEQLPADWPVSGTTGYEFIASLAEVLVDDNNLDQLQQVHDDALGGMVDRHKALREAQSWRLMSWREAPRQLSWRRFFEITGLIGVRVEDPAVFDDTHRLILELVHSGIVDGLRIDHIDGLADPLGYLQRLRQATGPECYITVEKILAKGEQLPADWPVSGTTGYEFIASLAEVLVDDNNLDQLQQVHDDALGGMVDRHKALREAKGLMADRNFEGEFTTLLKLARELAQRNGMAVESDALRHALRELLLAFPVYRTYGTAEGLTAGDITLLNRVVDQVNAEENRPDANALNVIIAILTGNLQASSLDIASLFRTRFQQLTGPLMAKSVEDTLFFRHNLDLALNEVGADPTPRAFSLSRFHQEMRIRLARQPDALLGTSTHDTKRGEDARARLYTLTEAPQLWAENLARWRQMNQTHVRFLNDGTAPNAADTWMIYQALAGAWPATLLPDDAEGLKSLETRFLAFMEKALREAKQRTDWIDSNESYESVVLNYVQQLFSADNSRFLNDFHIALQAFIRAGLVNSLSQTVIKLTAPGVPDIYQGSEALNFSLVDPDNRREPDFAVLAQNLHTGNADLFTREPAWRDGRLKQYVTASFLRLRQRHSALFHYGDWVPLKVSGEREDNLIAYARISGEEALIVVVPRLAFDVAAHGLAESSARLWGNTAVTIPDDLAGKRFRDVFSGESRLVETSLELASTSGWLLTLISAELRGE